MPIFPVPLYNSAQVSLAHVTTYSCAFLLCTPHSCQQFQQNCCASTDNCVPSSIFHLNYSVAIGASTFSVLLITPLWLIDSVSLSSIYIFAQFSGKEHPVRLAVQCTPPNLSLKLTSPIAPMKHSTESRRLMGWMAVHCHTSDYFLILFAQALYHTPGLFTLSSARKVSQVVCPAEPVEEHSFHL